MNESAGRLTAYQVYCKITGYIYRLMNFICVLCLAIELISVMVMVIGRYVFSSVPAWADQLSLMALVWMVIISITLSLYDESHMRVELIDKALPPKVIEALKYVSNILICIFSVLMTYHGAVLFQLTKDTTLSGFNVSQGLMYLPLIVCGVGSIYMSVFCMIRRKKEGVS